MMYPVLSYASRATLCIIGWYTQAALQQQAQEKKKKPPAVPRAAGGEKWWDPTLVEWPKDDFRLRLCPSRLSISRAGAAIMCRHQRVVPSAALLELLCFAPYFERHLVIRAVQRCCILPKHV